MVKQWFALPGVCRTTVRDPNLQTVLLFISQHDDHADHIGPEQLLSQFRTILVRCAPPFVIPFQPHNMVELRAIYRLDPILWCWTPILIIVMVKSLILGWPNLFPTWFITASGPVACSFFHANSLPKPSFWALMTAFAAWRSHEKSPWKGSPVVTIVVSILSHCHPWRLDDLGVPPWLSKPPNHDKSTKNVWIRIIQMLHPMAYDTYTSNRMTNRNRYETSGCVWE